MTESNTSLLERLASALSQEAYDTLALILVQLDDEVHASKTLASEAQSDNLTSIQLAEAFINALSLTPLTFQTPNPPAPPPCTANIKDEFSYFQGRDSDDIGSWLVIVEDYLTVQHVARADWAVQVVPLF